MIVFYFYAFAHWLVLNTRYLVGVGFCYQMHNVAFITSYIYIKEEEEEEERA
jgi:hypothetical protein